MDLLVLLGVAIVLLLVIWAVSRQSRPVRYAGHEPARADAEYRLRLPSLALLNRCLSVEDFAFTAGLRSPEIARLFLRERRRLALQWLHLTRREAGRLLSFHVRAVRHAADLRPLTEVRLLIHLVLFLVVYETMAILVRLYGPFHAQALLRSLQSLAGVLSGLGGRLAEAANPSLVPGAAHGN